MRPRALAILMLARMRIWKSMAPSCSHATQSSPRNSRSASRPAILSTPNRAMTRSTIEIRSRVLELPLLSRSCHSSGNGDAAVNDADHQDVHVSAAELPVGPIQGQPPGSLLAPHHRHENLGQGAEIEPDLLEEALQAAIVGGRSGRAPENGRPRCDRFTVRATKTPITRTQRLSSRLLRRAKLARSVSLRALSWLVPIVSPHSPPRESGNIQTFQRPTQFRRVP